MTASGDSDCSGASPPGTLSPPGVSLAICSFNGARRLRAVFESLERQKTTPTLGWEILLVDNASTDGTGRLAESLWRGHPDVPLRVLVESTPGLMHARALALGQAKYGCVSFIDDDNVLPPTWMQTVWELMQAHPDAGAVGGSSVARLSGPPPPWFSQHAKQFAVGEQAATGDVTEEPGYLWGAGLTLRRDAWLQLKRAGFRSQLTGRRGRSLFAGEDTELCFALRLAGWKLWYEPTLQLTHAIDQERLTWRHLRQMYRGFGASTVVFDAYRAELRRNSWRGVTDWHRQAWYVLKAFAQKPLRVRDLFKQREGDHGALTTQADLGRLIALARDRRCYDERFVEVARLSSALGSSCCGAPQAFESTATLRSS